MGLFDGLGGLGMGLGAVGTLYGMFNRPNFGAANQAMSQAGTAIGGMNNVAGQFGGLAQGPLNNVAGNVGQAQNFGNELENYYSSDPFTDSRSASIVAQNTGSLQNDMQRATANLQAGLAGRGMGGGDSSYLSGGLAGIQLGGMQNLAGAQNALQNMRLNAVPQFLQAGMGTAQGLAGQDWSMGTGALGQEAGILGNVAGDYQGLAQTAAQNAMAQGQYASGISSGLGSLGGSLFGFSESQPLYKAMSDYYNSL